MGEEFEREKIFIAEIGDYIAFDGIEDYIRLYEACIEISESVEGSVVLDGFDFKQLTTFINYQKEIDEKIVEAESLYWFIDCYNKLFTYGIYNRYSSFETYIHDVIINEYPNQLGDKFEIKSIINKFIRELRVCIHSIEDMLFNIPPSLNGFNIQKAFQSLNITYGDLIYNDNNLHELRYDTDVDSEDEKELLTEALNKVEGLDIDFKSIIGKTIPTTIEDVDKALESLWKDNRILLSSFGELTNRHGEYEIIKIDKSKFKNIFKEIESIIYKCKNYDRPIVFRDFISKTESLKDREDIFYTELEQSIKNKEYIALVGIMENPRAKKYKWEVTGAYDLNKDNWEFGAYESETQAAAYAYSFAKKFQIENKLFTRFISLSNKGHDEEGD